MTYKKIGGLPIIFFSLPIISLDLLDSRPEKPVPGQKPDSRPMASYCEIDSMAITGYGALTSHTLDTIDSSLTLGMSASWLCLT